MLHRANRLLFVCLLVVPNLTWASAASIHRAPAAHFSGVIDVKLGGTPFFVIEHDQVREAGSQRELLALPAAPTRSGFSRMKATFSGDLVAMREARNRASERCNCNSPDLGAWVSIDVSDLPYSAVLEVVNELAERSDVERVSMRRIISAPAADLWPTTPSFVAQQGYLGDTPNGIGATSVRHYPGSRGESVRVGDVENGWTLNHEDLPSCTGVRVDPSPYWGNDHGDAVLGEIFGVENSYGVTGIAPLASCYVSSHYDGQTVNGWSNEAAAAINALANEFRPGDVMVIEIHIPGPESPAKPSTSDPQKGYVPAEYDDTIFEAIKSAVDSGIVVVAAAGNGGQNLDAASLEGTFDRAVRDSGAIIVGAGGPASGIGAAPRTRQDFSCYGSRVDVQAWGRDVTTFGYGDHFFPNSDKRQKYTEVFSGTSSATPIVAGAVAVLQGVRRAAGLTPYNAVQMAALLKQTGSPQTGNTAQRIGPLPNLPAAINKMFECGNGSLDPGEVCDDNNTLDGDGCAADCRSNERCGNSVVDSAVGEQCDDGNQAGGDGCSANCRSNESCGNSVVDPGEQCDDGNLWSGDACSALCTITGGTSGGSTTGTNAGSTTGTAGSTGSTGGGGAARCGDGIVDPSLGEACDDNNNQSGDGCSADCHSDETCGNGTVDVNEQCDDGNWDNSDGCSSTCETEKRCDDGRLRVICPAKKKETTATTSTPVPAETTPVTKSGCNAVPLATNVDALMVLVAIVSAAVRRRQSV